MSMLMKLVPLMAMFDKLMSMFPANGKKTELMMAIKLGILPLLASVIPGLQPAMAGLALDTMMEIAIASAGLHKMVKLFLVRFRASMQG